MLPAADDPIPAVSQNRSTPADNTPSACVVNLRPQWSPSSESPFTRGLPRDIFDTLEKRPEALYVVSASRM